jgi:hypothetical protein
MTNQAKITISAEDRASRVLQQVRGQLASTTTSAADLAASAGLIGPAFATLASAAGLVSFVKSVADSVDALNDVADATGASIESLSKLERVARLGGGTIDDVSGLLIKFNQALAQTSNPASAAAGVFNALGLSAKELQAIDPADALQRTAVALAGFADNGEKARAVQELFGRSVKDAAPFLKDLVEQGGQNATITRQQAEAADSFNKELFKLRTYAEDGARAIVGQLLPAVNDLLAKTREGGVVRAFGLEDFPDLVRQAVSAYRLIGLARERITPLSILERDPNNPGALAELARIEAKARDLGNAFKDARQQYLGIGESQAGAGRGFINPPLALSSFGSGGGAAGKAKVTAPPVEIDRSTEALARYVDQLQREADTAATLTERQKALNLLRSIGTTGEIPQVRQLVLALAEEADVREQGLAFAKAMTAEMQRQADEQRGLDAALDNFAGRTADALKRAQVTRLEARLAAGEAFSPEELDRIVRGIGGIREAAEQTFNASNKSLDRFAENVQDALGSTVEATLRGDFDSIGRLWGNLLVKMAAEAIAADLGNALFGNLLKASGAGAAGAGFGLFGSLFGGLFGLGTGKAAGGTVQPWSMQRVNESGVEMFSRGGQDWLLAGPRGGKVTPNSALGGGSVVNVTQYITAGSQVSRNDLAAAMQVAKVQTVRAVADARRRTFAEGAV